MGKGTATVVKDTGRYVRVVPRTYSTRTTVPLRAVRSGEATTCISREDTYLQLEDKDITIVTGKWATIAQRNHEVFSRVFQRVSGLVSGTDSTHSRGSLSLVRSPGRSVRFPGSIVFDPFGLFGFAYSVSPRVRK